MAIVICALCFKRKEGTVVFPNTEPVCRGCFLDLDRATGWLESQGWGLIHGETGLVLGLEGVQTLMGGGGPLTLKARPEGDLPPADDDPPNPPGEPKEAPVVIRPKAKDK